MSDLKSNLGYFLISTKLLDDANEHMLKAIFNRVYVLNASANYGTQTVMYTACSPFFDYVQQGAVIPEYELTLFEDIGKFEVGWKKIEHRPNSEIRKIRLGGRDDRQNSDSEGESRWFQR